ncbi:hypothetical protein S245_009139, partial [Arachis hypogaea]
LGPEDDRSDVAGLIALRVRTMPNDLEMLIRDNSRDGRSNRITSIVCDTYMAWGLEIILFSGSYIRVRVYLLKISKTEIRFCAKVTSTMLEELKKLDSESTLLHKSKNAKSIPLLPLSNASDLDSRKRRAIGPLEKVFNVNTRETLDLHIVRMTNLLEKEKKHVKRMLEPTKNSWSGKGVSIVSDGWSDPQRRPLLNSMSLMIMTL